MFSARIGFMVAVLGAPTAGVSAPSPAEKLCIFKAAESLPLIPGLQIVESSTGTVPPEALARTSFHDMPGVTAMLVSLDVRAAAQTATFAFICGSNSVGTVVVPL